MKRVSVRLPRDLYIEAKDLVRQGYFSSLSQLIREAVIDFVEKCKRNELIVEESR